MDKLQLIEMILGLIQIEQTKTVPKENKKNSGSFLEIGKVYAVRTVTMIYTGRLLNLNEQEFLFDEVAWIPETERWKDFAETGAHKEAEPYTRPVVINRGAVLDVTEIPKTITKQK